VLDDEGSLPALATVSSFHGLVDISQPSPYRKQLNTVGLRGLRDDCEVYRLSTERHLGFVDKLAVAPSKLFVEPAIWQSRLWECRGTKRVHRADARRHRQGGKGGQPQHGRLLLKAMLTSMKSVDRPPAGPADVARAAAQWTRATSSPPTH
jgi:hypothetical protein